MESLKERWPELSSLPYLPVLEGPTPVQELTDLSYRTGGPVWCKRDDLTSAVYGGNKVRKLGFLIADAQRREADRVKHLVARLGPHALPI